MTESKIIEILRSLKQNGKSVIGCFPLYPPLELIHAMGFTPVVLWGLKGTVRQTDESDKHLQAYTCSVARHLTQFLLSEGKDIIDGLFMYNACDTLRNLPEIFMNEFSASGRPLPVIRMHIPVTAQNQTHAARYFENEIRSVVNSFQDYFSVAFSMERFIESRLLYDRLKKLNGQIEQEAANGNLSFLTYSRIMQDGWFLPVQDQIRALESLLEKTKRSREVPADQRSRPGVILSGILPPPESVISAIEAAGLTVAGNDIASLHRAYADICETPSTPVEYYAKFYLEHYPCPTLLYTGDRRLKTLMDLIERAGAKGVIFVGEKFCEYEYFEFPYIEECLKVKGIQALQLEISIEDEDQTSAYQARIEAFAEMIHQL